MDTVKNAENNVESIEIFNNDTCDLVADRADAESYEAPEFLSQFDDGGYRVSELLTAIGVEFDFTADKDDLAALLNEKFDPKNAEHVAAAKDVIEKVIWNNLDLYIDVDDQYKVIKLMVDALRNRGLLKGTARNKNYLCFGSNMGWQQRSGYTMQEINNIGDIMDMLHGDYDYTAHVYEHPGKPYLTAEVSSHDAPTGESYTIIPEPWVAEAIKNPELEGKIRGAMRDDKDVRDVIIQHLRDMLGKNEVLTGIKYGVIDAIDNVNLRRLSCPDAEKNLRNVAENLAVLNKDAFEDAVEDEFLANQESYGCCEIYHADYRDYCDGIYKFQSELPEKRADKALVDGIYKVMQTSDEQKIGQMVDGLLGENRNKEVKRLKKMGKEQAAGR